jgi:hypothetical protein
VPGAVCDHVGGQLVYGQDHLADPVLRQPGLADVGLYGCPQRVQRAGIKLLIQDWRLRARLYGPAGSGGGLGQESVTTQSPTTRLIAVIYQQRREVNRG